MLFGILVSNIYVFATQLHVCNLNREREAPVYDFTVFCLFQSNDMVCSDKRIFLISTPKYKGSCIEHKVICYMIYDTSGRSLGANGVVDRCQDKTVIVALSIYKMTPVVFR